MKSIVASILATLALAAVPDLAEAKDRGCAVRLTALYDAERDLGFALRRGRGIEEARVALSRAREKAREERCDPRAGFDRDRFSYRDRDRDRDRGSYGRSYEERRFDELVFLGQRRGLTPSEFRELADLRRRLGRR